MTDIGYLALVIAFGVAAYTTIAAILGSRTGRFELVRSAENGILALFGLTTIATIALVYALVTRDFQVAYVANYTSRDLSLAYTISALYAGNDGSLLFWVFMLTLFGSIAVVQNRNRHRLLIPHVIAVVGIVALFFLVLLVFFSNPFQRLPFRPADGRGLNPLLVNPGMFFHPPTLYVGYVGFTIPFAFAVAALISGQLGDAWIKSTRRWSIFAWFFLALGNMFGAWWAYNILGWGGYWGWDPVENASFLPFLTGTAYLHSVMIQEKKDMLKVWNMVLIMLTFSLSIFGTFLTRSGILSSVHSFGQSSLGPMFLGFLAVILFASLGLLMWRLPLLKSENQLDSILSRESSFLFNNLILVGIAFTVLWGTVFPLISEAVRGVKVTVGPPFYNQVTVPLGLALLIVTGICPLIAWRRASWGNLQKNFLLPFGVGVAGGLLLFASGVRDPLAAAALAILIFVGATITLEFYRGTRARHVMAREPLAKAFFTLIGRNQRRYGGYIIHLGVLLLVLAVVGGAFKVEKETTLKPGETIEIGKFVLRYDTFSRFPTATKEVEQASLAILQGGRKIGTLRPQRIFHKASEQPHTQVDLRMTMAEDLYLILAGMRPDGTATFKAIVNPLMFWMWAGSYLMGFGTLIVMWPGRREREFAKAKYAVEAREHATAS